MYVLKCNSTIKLEANLPFSSSVQRKIEYWKNKPESIPISVLFFGIDTVSQSHAFRGMPRVISLMKNMGFHDFQAFHSLAPSTFNLFMAVLMGMEKDKVRRTCAPDWSSPFDSCPFIWKTFSDLNYVTMFAEDEPQTFDWGGQAGFRTRPTDYYINELFDAIEALRPNISLVRQYRIARFSYIQAVSYRTVHTTD
jgi:hypothetical protein